MNTGKRRLVVVDAGGGNLHSVLRSFARSGANAVLSSDPDVVRRADKLVLPGVGHFGKAMSYLRSRGLVEALNDARRERDAAVLGICLGMQMLASGSEEASEPGLSWLDAKVVRFRVADPLRIKVPHSGWNAVELVRESPLVQRSAAEEEFYFLHAFHLMCADPADVIAESVYSYRFASAVQKGNIFGVQFHPEKSRAAGERLLGRFAQL